MDITTYLTASEIRARIFICQAKIYELKQKRKKYQQNIKGAKTLIKNIERCIDKKLDSELRNFEVSSVATCLKFLRETLCDLDYFWQKEVEYCTKLHRKMDELGERVYL